AREQDRVLALDLVELAGDDGDLVDRVAEPCAVAAAQPQRGMLDVVEASHRGHAIGTALSQNSGLRKRERPRLVDTAFPLTFRRRSVVRTCTGLRGTTGGHPRR